MSRPSGIEQAGQAGPYLKLIGEALSLPPESGRPDENGFIAVTRPGLRAAVAQRQQDLVGSQERVQGDEQVLAILDKAAGIRAISSLAILTRPSEGNLRESLEFRTFESVNKPSRGSDRLSASINHLATMLEASKVRLSVIHMFSVSTDKEPPGPEVAVEIQQAENEAPEEMRELGWGHPGEQPYKLQYLIRFD